MAKLLLKRALGTKLADRFAQTDAYSELFMELVTDADAASNFVNGIIPDDLKVETPVNGIESPNQDPAGAM